ncbi:hypothetical protein [Marinobacterium lutimaris]|uniref:Uncharacterized protein n=1 Tax=Marinobacterium lutimaris TaxID=568106 RepID=A0A1H5Y8H6_9GAMM|nr:hypothetical protein [Marinobacterium lutimaris]SEG20132.1 hypothetical protein SAMN05444390_1011654 [Marinobacterium lutimaris]
MARKYGMDFYSTLITAPVLAADSAISVGTAPDALASGDFYRFLVCREETVNGKVVMTRAELIDWAYDGTVTRGVDGTIALDWEVGDIMRLVVTASTLDSIPDVSGLMTTSGGTLVDGTITEFAETINAASGATLDRGTGGKQKLTLAANTTLDLTDLGAGQSVSYKVIGGDTYALGYTGLGHWSNGTTPELKATHYLEFTHDGDEVVGFDCGGWS